jgi:hypothetical protein
MEKKECKHIWEIVSSWGINTYWMRRICILCKERQVATINPKDWKVETCIAELSDNGNMGSTSPLVAREE